MRVVGVRTMMGPERVPGAVDCRIGHPLPALANNWTRGAAHRHTTAPISHSRPSPRSS